MLAREVVIGQPAADTLEIAIDSPGDRALIEGRPAAFGDHAVGPGEVRIAEHVAFARRLAPRHVDVPGVGGLLDAGAGAQEGRHVARDVEADDLRLGDAGLAEVDRRLEQLRPLQLAVALVQRPPGVERSGRGDGYRAERRQGAVLRTRARRFEAEALGRAPGTGEADHLRLFGIPAMT